MERSFYAKFIKPFISLKTRETMLKLAYSYYISYRSAGSFKEYVKGKLIYIFQYFLPNTEKYNLYAFMGKYGFCHFPYPFTLQYRPEDVVVYFDEDWLLPYVLHQKKKLYYPIEDITNYEIQIAYNNLNMEQDPASPHRYINDIEGLSGKILLDIGAAEGIFALDVIEYVKKAYLFECEEKWIKPLEATFSPWKDKVFIFKKKVTGNNMENEISLNYFLSDKNDLNNIFIKMDIEGGEQTVLNASLDVLKKRDDVELAVCTYHLSNDKEQIERLLTSLDYFCSYTDGFFYINKEFRKAILRAHK